MGITDSKGRILLTPVEAGKHLGISRSAIYRLMKKGRLDTTQLPGVRQTYVTLSSAEDYQMAKGMTHKELVELVLDLKRRVVSLEGARAPARAGKVEVQGHDEDALMAELRRRHPDVYAH